MSHCIRRHTKFLSGTCLYYKTCHTNLSKTRLEYKNTPTLLTMTKKFALKSQGEVWPGWNCRHGKLFTERLGWNKMIWRNILNVLNMSPVTRPYFSLGLLLNSTWFVDNKVVQYYAPSLFVFFLGWNNCARDFLAAVNKIRSVCSKLRDIKFLQQL